MHPVLDGGMRFDNTRKTHRVSSTERTESVLRRVGTIMSRPRSISVARTETLTRSAGTELRRTASQELEIELFRGRRIEDFAQAIFAAERIRKQLVPIEMTQYA